MSGIFGVVSKNDCMKDLFYGTDYHTHLGTEYGGLAVLGKDGFSRQIHSISQSQFKSKFYEDYRHMSGNKCIGVISAFDEQPIYVNSKFGPFCIVTNGLIQNVEKLALGLLARGVSFSEMTKHSVNPTELVAKLIVEGVDFVDGIEKAFDAIEGSCSLLILSAEGIYAARDKRGCTPLVIGKRKDAWAVTSETAAFTNLGFETAKYLGPGEVMLMDDNGASTRRPAETANQICTFLWIYTGFPASDYEGINTEIVSERSGALMARKDKDIGVDMVSGVPDSGVGDAIGYAMESGKPYRRPLVKYTPGYGRSYTPPSQETRDLIATMKLIPIKEVISGKRIVVCEDSIVRGTQLKNFAIKKLWNAGAREIHVRPACPPLMFPCHYNLSTRTTQELVARRAIKSLEGREIEDVSEYVDDRTPKYRKMVDWICKDIGVTTLRYQTVDDMVKAIGLPKDKLCLHCWAGGCRKAKGSCEKAKGKAQAGAGRRARQAVLR